VERSHILVIPIQSLAAFVCQAVAPMPGVSDPDYFLSGYDFSIRPVTK
jgi:hypothetical protein